MTWRTKPRRRTLLADPFYSTSRSTAAVGNVRLTIPVTSSSPGGFYNILCVLPARSKVHGYLVPEY